MRANRTFIKKVEEKIAGLRTMDAVSYLRGTINKGFSTAKVNSATTDELQKLFENVRNGLWQGQK